VRFIKKLMTCEGMVDPNRRFGPIPTTREGYAVSLRIAWPSMLESMLVAMVNLVGTVMVGGLGDYAITAVGLTTQPQFVLIAVIISLNVGVTAVIARRKGAQDREGANSCLKQAALLSLLLSVVLTITGLLAARPLMQLAGAQADTIDYAVMYFRIICTGMVFRGLSLTLNAAQRGVGNTRIALTSNLTANVVNLVFNYLLINGIGMFPRMEIAGSAVAAVLGNAAAFFMALLSLFRKDAFLTLRHRAKWKLEAATMASVGKVAASAAVEQVCMRIGFFAYAIMIAALGTENFAVHQICMSILNISFSIGDGLSVAAAALVGQSLGAKRPDLGKLYGSVAQRISWFFSTILFFIFLLGRFRLVGLFNSDPYIVSLGGSVMVILAFTTHIQTSQVIMAGCLRGAGDTKFTAVVAMVSIMIVRPTLGWLLCFPAGLGLRGAWMALFIDQALRLILNILRFRSGKWALHTI